MLKNIKLHIVTDIKNIGGSPSLTVIGKGETAVHLAEEYLKANALSNHHVVTSRGTVCSREIALVSLALGSTKKSVFERLNRGELFATGDVLSAAFGIAFKRPNKKGSSCRDLLSL